MTVKEIIEILLETHDENEEIIVAWWTKDMAPCDIENVPWEDQIYIIENKMDWSGTHGDMNTCIEYCYNEKES